MGSMPETGELRSRDTLFGLFLDSAWKAVQLGPAVDRKGTVDLFYSRSRERKPSGSRAAPTPVDLQLVRNRVLISFRSSQQGQRNSRALYFSGWAICASPRESGGEVLLETKCLDCSAHLPFYFHWECYFVSHAELMKAALLRTFLTGGNKISLSYFLPLKQHGCTYPVKRKCHTASFAPM